MMAGDGDGEAAAAEETPVVAKDEEEMTEEERIAQLGKPKLGDLVAINVHIRESIEFKVLTPTLCMHCVSKPNRHYSVLDEPCCCRCCRLCV